MSRRKLQQLCWVFASSSDNSEGRPCGERCKILAIIDSKEEEDEKRQSIRDNDVDDTGQENEHG